jgi:hypothetical protein
MSQLFGIRPWEMAEMSIDEYVSASMAYREMKHGG